jgi:hypothetical protein
MSDNGSRGAEKILSRIACENRSSVTAGPETSVFLPSKMERRFCHPQRGREDFRKLNRLWTYTVYLIMRQGVKWCSVPTFLQGVNLCVLSGAVACV